MVAVTAYEYNREPGVDKAPMLLRWPSRESLLADSLVAQIDALFGGVLMHALTPPDDSAVKPQLDKTYAPAWVNCVLASVK